MFSKNLTLFFKGVAMGTADLMPGVSGGTIALILGVYKELILSINSINLKNLKSLKTEGFIVFWKKINGNFLSVLFIGIITAVFCFSFLIDWLVTHHPIPLWSFFFGLLLASIFLLKNTLKAWSKMDIVLMLVSAALSFMFTQMTPNQGDISLFYLFICGFFGIIAMILPGISGAYILLIMGAYTTIIGLVKDVVTGLTTFEIQLLIPTIQQLAVFVLGIVLGLRIFASILKWLFDKEHDKTMAVLIGLMVGALHKIWPWQKESEYVLDGESIIRLKPVSPLEYPEHPQLVLAVIFFAIGLGIVGILERKKQIDTGV